MNGGEIENLISVFMTPNSWSLISINKHLLTSCSTAEVLSLRAREPFTEGLLCVSPQTEALGDSAQNTDLYRGEGSRAKRKAPIISLPSTRTESTGALCPLPMNPSPARFVSQSPTHLQVNNALHCLGAAGLLSYICTTCKSACQALLRNPGTLCVGRQPLSWSFPVPRTATLLP